MAEIRIAHLMTLTLAVAGMQAIGATPNGNRRIGLVAAGTFQGERLRGTFETAAAHYDWLNRIIAVGTGRRPPEGRVYDVFGVL